LRLQLPFIMDMREQLLDSAKHRAEEAAQDSRKASSVLDNAMRKAALQEGRLQSMWGDLQALFRLLRAWLQGAYREVPWKTIVLVLAALIYFVDPLDLIPDTIIGIGYLDDATVLAWVLRSIKQDMDRFLAWEKTAG